MSVRLSGEHVTLRPYREGEFEAVWAEMSRDRGPHEEPWPPGAQARLEERIATSGQWQARSSLVLAVEARGLLIGDVQARTSLDVFPPGLFEVGIELFADARSEVLTRYLFDEEQASRVQLGTDVDNAAMRRVAEKAGFTFEGVMRSFWPVAEGEPRDYALYARTRADHEGR